MIETVMNFRDVIFAIDLALHYILLAGILWSIFFYDKRIWPPPKAGTWQKNFTWFCFYAVFILSAVLMLLDWNSWVITEKLRYLLGIPVTMVGVMLFLWGFFTLGVQNTSGERDGFRSAGPYKFTRNPQYLGDMFLFAGLVLISNSILLLIVNALLILIFLLTPFSEEKWLEIQYGETYLAYKKETPRFL